jgi:hypothetical protein
MGYLLVFIASKKKNPSSFIRAGDKGLSPYFICLPKRGLQQKSDICLWELDQIEIESQVDLLVFKAE